MIQIYILKGLKAVRSAPSDIDSKITNGLFKIYIIPTM